MGGAGGAPTRMPSILRAGAASFLRMWAGWRRFWSWRRIRFTRGGAVFTLGAFAVGFSAINTGNNLLYLLLGAMLGFIAVSSWLSEQVIGAVRVQRRAPRGVTAGNPARIDYHVQSGRRRIPSFALEIGEEGLRGQAFLPFLGAAQAGLARSENSFLRRGVVPLQAITVSTSFPFGLFRKSRSIGSPGELVVWPRTDRRLPRLSPAGATALRAGSLSSASSGPRGEYRGLREYRPGDDPRDIHWRSTARFGRPMVREYDQGEAETLWLCLDTRGRPGDRAEIAVEMVAALAARAFREGRRFALAVPGLVVEAGQGRGQLDRVLDALARVDFLPTAPPLTPPVDRGACVLVCLRRADGRGFGAALTPPRDPPE